VKWLPLERWLLAACALFAGCGGPPIGEVFDAPATRPPPPLPLLAAGDVIEVEFARAAAPRGEYRLGVGDRVKVEVQLRPELAATLTVAPDGCVTFHRIGAELAAGRTLEQLRAALEAALTARAQLPESRVSVFLEQGDVALDRVIDTLLRHPSGTLRELTVGADGRVSLPLIGALLVGGLAPHEVEELVNQRLAVEVAHLRASVRVKQLQRDQFTVAGEVWRPGRYPLSGSLTLIDAIALAGGDTPVADLSAVLVVGAPQGEHVEAWLYDVETALEHGSALPQVRVHPQDTIVLLRTGIGDVNAFVDQWIRRNIPVNMTFTYRLDDPDG